MATAEEQVQIDTLRDLLGEPASTEGSLFTDTKLLGYIQTSDSINHAALMGWRVKMAHFANLVNTVDGAAVREMSDLFLHAQDMVKYYGNQAKSPSYGRSRVGRIERG